MGEDAAQKPATGEPNANDAPPATGDKGAEHIEAAPSDTDWQAEAEKWRKLAQKHEARAKGNADAVKRLGEIEDANRTEPERIERATREAVDNARKEALTASNRRIIAAEIRAAAGGRLADPADAVLHVNLDDFDVPDEGDIDTKAIAKAIDALLAAKPYLAATGRRFEGGADAGVRETSPHAEVAPGIARIQAAYAQKYS